MIAEYQKAAWVGGKKNDIVICYGPGWSMVFGWTDSELVKENIKSLFLTEKHNNELFAKVKTEVIQNYKIKDWSKFDYISIEPRTAHFVWFFIIMALTQTGLYIFFYMNLWGKGDDGTLSTKKGRFGVDRTLRFR